MIVYVLIISFCCSLTGIVSFIWLFHRNFGIAVLVATFVSLTTGSLAATPSVCRCFYLVYLRLLGFRAVSREAASVIGELLEDDSGVYTIRCELVFELTVEIVSIEGLPKYQFAVMSWDSGSSESQQMMAKPRINDDELRLVYFEKVVCR